MVGPASGDIAMKRLMAALCLLSVAAGPAAAQSGPPNPFVYTCGDFMTAQDADQRYFANLMVYWIVGYMHGRFADEPRLTLDQAHHDSSVTDIVTALQRICPNVPTMPLATVSANLANDLAKTLQ